MGHLARISRATIVEFAISTVGFYPYVCRNCKGKSFVLRPKQTVLAILSGLILFGALLLSFSYFNPGYQIRESGREIADSLPPVVWPGDQIALPKNASRLPARSNIAESLTNEDVIKVWKSGVGTIRLSSLIRRSEHRFTVDAESINKLRQSGVPEGVILTMIELTSPDAKH